MLDLNNSMPIQIHVFLLMFFFLNFYSNAFVFGANFCEYISMKIHVYGYSSYAYECVQKSGQRHQLIYLVFLECFFFITVLQKNLQVQV